MAWRRVVCTAGFSENYLKKEFVSPFLQKNQDVLYDHLMPAVWATKIFLHVGGGSGRFK